MTMSREAFRRMAVAAMLALLPAAVQAANAALTPGIQAFEARRYEEARAFFEPYAKRNPKDAEASFYLGKIYLYLKKSDPAADWLEKATAFAPDRSDYFDWLGRAYGQQAIEASVFAKLLKTDPGNWDSEQGRGPRRLSGGAQARPPAGGREEGPGVAWIVAIAQRGKILDTLRHRSLGCPP
jgi:tetratricopeptide (TPR) repeat protein